jgi:hypothetical protein
MFVCCCWEVHSTVPTENLKRVILRINGCWQISIHSRSKENRWHLRFRFVLLNCNTHVLNGDGRSWCFQTLLDPAFFWDFIYISQSGFPDIILPITCFRTEVLICLNYVVCYVIYLWGLWVTINDANFCMSGTLNMELKHPKWWFCAQNRFPVYYIAIIYSGDSAARHRVFVIMLSQENRSLWKSGSKKTFISVTKLARSWIIGKGFYITLVQKLMNTIITMKRNYKIFTYNYLSNIICISGPSRGLNLNK